MRTDLEFDVAMSAVRRSAAVASDVPLKEVEEVPLHATLLKHDARQLVRNQRMEVEPQKLGIVAAAVECSAFPCIETAPGILDFRHHSAYQ